MATFDEVEHTADWAFRARGETLPLLFINAAFAMFSLEGIQAEGKKTGQTIIRELEVQAVDKEGLLVNWLNELLYIAEVDRQFPVGIEILDLAPQRLRARLELIAEERPDRRIKAVTFHNLRVEQTPHGWEATVVVDV
jgi:SHS2 domain-containing protein